MAEGREDGRAMYVKNLCLMRLFLRHVRRLDESTGRIDYDKMEENAALFRPKLLVAGASAYARTIDYERMRKVSLSLPASLSLFLSLPALSDTLQILLTYLSPSLPPLTTSLSPPPFPSH